MDNINVVLQRLLWRKGSVVFSMAWLVHTLADPCCHHWSGCVSLCPGFLRFKPSHVSESKYLMTFTVLRVYAVHYMPKWVNNLDPGLDLRLMMSLCL